MLVLVDGYNVTMRDPDNAGLSKEAQREALLARLRVHASALAPGGTVVVVFDAREALLRTSDGSGAVTAVYAPDADDEIVRRCESASGAVLVVTDDLRLRARLSQDVGRHVRFDDARRLFAAELHARARSTRDRPLVRETGMPQGANEITEELKKLWLDDEDE